MDKNIVMQITHECNPDEARFRTGDFLIGTTHNSFKCNIYTQ